MLTPDMLISERNGSVATLRLNLPERLNPLGMDLQEALKRQIATLRDDETLRALLITGTGGAFCVGADLDELYDGLGSGHGARLSQEMEEVSNRIIEGLQTLHVPVVCAVNGPCAGAGVGLALAADVVLMARSAYFYLPFMPRLGLVPDLGTTWFLSRMVGRSRALALCMMGDRVSAEQSADWGLVWAAVEDADLQGTALALAQRLGRMPPHAALELRRAFSEAAQNSLIEQMRYEAVRQRELLDSPVFAEGVRAFKEKRSPVFHVQADGPCDEKR